MSTTRTLLLKSALRSLKDAIKSLEEDNIHKLTLSDVSSAATQVHQAACEINQAKGMFIASDEAALPIHQFVNMYAELQRPVNDLELTLRTATALADFDVKTIGDLVQMTENNILCIPAVGRRSLEEIKDRLKVKKLALGVNLPNWNKK
jgi:DNA-directed RNA polymerase alpha subunit